jgi:hypothetical protein
MAQGDFLGAALSASGSAICMQAIDAAFRDPQLRMSSICCS